MRRRRRVWRVAAPNSPPARSTPYCLRYGAGSRRPVPHAAAYRNLKSRRGGLEATRKHFIGQLGCQRFVTLSQRQRHHRHPICKVFQITFAVEGFQRVTGIELPCAKERLEAKAAGVSVVEQAEDEGALVTCEDRAIVIPFPNQRVRRSCWLANVTECGRTWAAKKASTACWSLSN